VGLLAEAEALAKGGQEVEAARLVAARLSSLEPARRGEARLAVARFYHRAEVYGPALDAAEAVLRDDPGSLEALYLQGDCLRRLQRLSEAEPALEKLLVRAPKHHRARLSLACIRFRSGDPAESLPLFEAYFKAAAGDEKEYGEALLEHGRALRAAGRFQEAADRFTLLLEKDPLDAPLYSELASTLYRERLRREGRFVEEIYKIISQSGFEEHVEKGLEKTGASAFALAQRAANRIRQRRFLAAFQCYRRAVELDPQNALIRYHAAGLSLRFHRRAEALSFLTDGVPPDVRPASGIRWLKGCVLIEGGVPSAALEAAREGTLALAREGDLGGIERGQASPFSLSLVTARAALEAGRLEAAAEAADAALAQIPQSWEPHYWRGRIEFARGDAASALPRLEEAVRRGGQGLPDLLLYRALALEKIGRREEAARELRGLAQAKPGYLPVYEPLLRLAGGADAGLEESHRKLREAGREAEALERSLEKEPLLNSGEGYLKLGKLNLVLRDPVAFDFLFLASDLVPANAEALRLLLSGMREPQDLFVRISLLRRLLAIEPGDPAVLGELAERYLWLHVRLEEATRLAGELHRLRPSAWSHRLCGELELAAGRREAGIETLRRGLQAFPSDSPLREALGRASGGPGGEPGQGVK
jgi:tetratricopeptide (TPR) repeat protein